MDTADALTETFVKSVRIILLVGDAPFICKQHWFNCLRVRGGGDLEF